MRIKSLLFLCTLWLVAGGGVCLGQIQDAKLRQRLTGKWAVEEFHPNGTRTGTALWTIAKNGCYRYEWTNAFPDSVRWVASEGTIQVKDGFVIQTMTNVVTQGRPESKHNSLPDGGVTGRTKILRLSDHELVLETNVMGRATYTKVGD